MVRIGWTKRSLRQLKGIRQFIAQDSPFQAKRVGDLIKNSVKKLEQHPEFGAVVSEANDDMVREISVFNYRVIYRWDEENRMIRVLLVLHGARLLDEEMLED